MIPKILEVVWGEQKGYVCLSAKDPTDKSWQDHLFQWPENKKDVDRFIRRNSDNLDLYWAPMVFNESRRKSENSTACAYLWADLDPVNPYDCYIVPSIAWESSPGRYQAIWLLDEPIDPVDHDELNKRMTYACGADKSGWDLTQVLRIPGTLNHKYVEKPPVKMMWMKNKTFEPQSLANQLPPIRVDTLIDVDDLEIEFNDLRELVWPYRRILGDKLWELLFTPASRIQEGERSDRIWELESRLIESNIPIAEIVKIAKASPWNKYKGRPDENKRILSEVLKAEKKIRQGPLIVPGFGRVPWVTYGKLMGQVMTGPGWMIEGIWANNSHGMIAGEPKTYKSIISTEIAVSIASGLPMWDQFKVKRQGPVLMIQEENAPWVVQDRLMKIAHGKGLVKGAAKIVGRTKMFVTFPPELPIKILNNWGLDLTVREHRDVIEAELDRLRPVLLILDPLYLMLGSLDDNSARELRDVLSWLLQLKVTYNTSIMILHHWNKGGQSGRGGQRMLGSTTLHAWVESALYTSIPDPIKNTISIEREFRSFMKPANIMIDVSMSEPGKELKYGVKVDTRLASAMGKRDQNDLMGFLHANGPTNVSDMAAYMEIGTNGMRKALKKYTDLGYVVQTKRGLKGTGNSGIYTLTQKGINSLNRGSESL